jgi:uncharacterized protein (TIGR02147 family)
MLEMKTAGAGAPPPPRLLEYEDYHRFLADFYAYKKAHGRGFSFRRFASLAGIRSSNYLQLVMKNKRRLSPEMAKAVAQGMKLSAPETEYFTALVKLEHSTSEEARAEAVSERDAAVSRVASRVLPRQKAEYLSRWYYPLVRELAFLPDFQLKPRWISLKLEGLIDEDHAEKAIEVLCGLGFWKAGPDGRIVVRDIILETGPETRKYGSVKVSDIHKGNLEAWARILGSIPPAERELGLLHIPIDEKKLPELKARIRRFQDEIIGWLQDEKAPTQVVQLGTYLLPMTRKVSEKKSEG